MSNWNLSDNVNDSFSFVIRDKRYNMRYPRTEEIDQVQDINVRLEDAKNSKDAEEVKKISQSLEDFLYSFISPEGHETPIKETLSHENVKVLGNFNKMIAAELSLD